MAYKYNLQSKLERAIVAYLVSKGCGTNLDIFPFESLRDRSLFLPGSTGNTTIQTSTALVDIQFTGNYRIPVLVSVQGSISQGPGATNPGGPRVAFDGRVAVTGDFLNQTDNGQNLQATATDITAAGRLLATTGSAQEQANNADMVDFTINGWFEKGFGKGEAKEANAAWEIVLLFECVCCPANVD
jgi:hypothetical protein